MAASAEAARYALWPPRKWPPDMEVTIAQAVLWWLVLLILGEVAMDMLDLQGWRDEAADTITSMVNTGLPMWLVFRHLARHRAGR
jgi:hypothetical protein